MNQHHRRLLAIAILRRCTTKDCRPSRGEACEDCRQALIDYDLDEFDKRPYKKFSTRYSEQAAAKEVMGGESDAEHRRLLEVNERAVVVFQSRTGDHRPLYPW